MERSSKEKQESSMAGQQVKNKLSNIILVSLTQKISAVIEDQGHQHLFSETG